MMASQYTTQLQAGLGMIEESIKLLDYFSDDQSVTDLYNEALDSGAFPNVTARRLRNIIAECFSPRFMKAENIPAYVLKGILKDGRKKETEQLFFLATARANKIFYDFVIDVYWPAYTSYNSTIKRDDAKSFILDALSNKKMKSTWSDTTISRVSGYLIGCLSDFHLIDNEKRKSERVAQTFRPLGLVTTLLAYDLHFRGFADNSLISHSDWKLFGFNERDVRDELKRLSRNGYFLIQTANDVVRIGWNYNSWEELLNVILES
jgi:hypothetical protein